MSKNDIRYDGGLGRVPEEVRAALAFAAYEADRLMTLNNGRDALFFTFIRAVNEHTRTEEELLQRVADRQARLQQGERA